jgi:hypothetical protein
LGRELGALFKESEVTGIWGVKKYNLFIFYFFLHIRCIV